MELSKIMSELDKMTSRSHWGRAVIEDARMMVGMVTDDYGIDSIDSWDQLKRCMLCGADTWLQSCDGGKYLVYDQDIAEHYCTPSEYKRCNGGDWAPNRRESWMEVQARAIKQASGLIHKAYSRASRD